MSKHSSGLEILEIGLRCKKILKGILPMEIREIMLPEFEAEMKKTRAMLKRVPEGQAGLYAA
jgi:hypothetical protein